VVGLVALSSTIGPDHCSKKKFMSELPKNRSYIYRGEIFVAPNFTSRKIGRNESCPCGSGKKYKHCCRDTGGRRLTETLDQILEPRVAPGKPGRTKGAGNYEWTPEMDKALCELLGMYDRGGPVPLGRLATAKRVMSQRLMELCPREWVPRKDSLRRAVERHMVFLGLSTGNPRKKVEPNPAECTPKKAPKKVRSGAWTPHEICALLGTIGGDLINETLVDRTHHSPKACYAKLYRLGYTVNELRSGAFTVDEVAEMFQVTTRRVRTWKEKGWLKTTRRRVTDKDLKAFIKEHHELIAFDALDICIRTFLLDLGYPAKEASSFKANVKAIQESVAGRKKRCDAEQTSGRNDSPRSEEGALKRILDKISRWNQLIGPKGAPWNYPWPSSLAFAVQAAR
jgi:hypothetical protein